MSEAYLQERLLDLVPGGASVLDVGAGQAKYHEALAQRAGKLTLLDAHGAYLKGPNAPPRNGPLSFANLWLGDARSMLPTLADREYDLVIGIDFLEHLEDDDAIDVLQHMNRIAAVRTILFIPEGNHPQESLIPWQVHRSTWWKPDLESRGFAVERWENFHAVPGKDPHALWCVRERAPH